MMDTFTVRDLRERTGELIRDAEAGKLSLVTKHGRPVFLAVPFDETLVREGLPVSLAFRLFDQEIVTLGQGARLAGMSVSEFIDQLGAVHIPVVRYAPGELEGEVEDLRRAGE